MRKIILIVIFFGLAGCASVPPYTHAPVSPIMATGVSGARHRVEAGQTLWRISKLYDVDIDDILKVNNISEDAVIEIGQVLLIPDRSIGQQNKLISSTVKPGTDDFIWPLKGRVIAGFAATHQDIVNKGINLQGLSQADVLAARSGRVVFYVSDFGNFGNTLIIDHGDGLRTVYSRVSEVFVRSGEDVQRGQVIARMGSKNREKGAYLHFEIRKGALPQNPLFYLPR